MYSPSLSSTDINKGSPIDYKSGSACSTPTKDTLKGGYERSTQGCMGGPVLPPRSMNGMPTHHYSAPMNFRKDLAARCSANWVSIVAFSVIGTIIVLLILLTGTGILHWSPSAPCTVLVGNEAAEVTAAKSTNTDLSKLHNASVRAKNGQGIGIVQGQPGGAGSSTATVTTATSNSGTAQGLQSTSASAEATSAAAAATATSSSQSSLAPSPSLSSSLANANNGGNYAQVLIIFK